MRLIIAAGGTGGHVYPAVAIAKEISKQSRNVSDNTGLKLLFIGKKNGMESKIIRESGFSFKGIVSAGIKGKNLFGTFIGLLKVTIGCFETLNVFMTFRPNLVLCMGGFVSVPVVIIAKIFGITIILHEQNSIPGLANRIFSKYAKKVLISFEDTKKYFTESCNCIFTGNPAREEFFTVTRTNALQYLNLQGDRKTLLIIGGSQGAHSINTATKEFIDILKKESVANLNVIWVTGIRDYEVMCKTSMNLEGVGSRVIIYPFIKNIWDFYAISDLVVARSGATTIAEITSIGRASILIPFPKAIYDHQMKNAEILFKKGAAVVLCDDGLTGEVLFKTIFDVLNNADILSGMAKSAKELGRINSAKIITDEIYKTYMQVKKR